MFTKSQELMVALIGQLATNFVGMVFRYGYDAVSNQHIVEVQPHSLYNSEEYMLAEGEVLNKFHSHYDTEGLLFTSNDPHITLPAIIYTAASQKITEASQFYHELSKKGIIIDVYQRFETLSVTDLFDCISTDEQLAVVLGKRPENITSIDKSMIDVNECSYALAA